jgi:hypothetical protein
MTTATITQGKYPSGQTFYKVEARSATGKRIRKFFADGELAKADADRIQKANIMPELCSD